MHWHEGLFTVLYVPRGHIEYRVDELIQTRKEGIICNKGALHMSNDVVNEEYVTLTFPEEHTFFVVICSYTPICWKCYENQEENEVFLFI